MKNFIITILVLGLIGVGIYFLVKKLPTDVETTQPQNTEQTEETQNVVVDESKTVIGQSVEAREITAYHYLPTQAGGTGETELLFVGGIHGGYSWNTSLVAYEMMDYLETNPDIIPNNVKVTIVPVLNPDGLNKVVGTTTDADHFTKADVSSSQITLTSGRFNAHEVDLNRNFDCDWQPRGLWQTTSVSGGSKQFSEPESLAIKNYIETSKPDAVVVWYSAAGGVFSSSCGDGILAETSAITNDYAKASGYKEYASFDFYPTTGDMVNWLAKMKIPAISVLLTNHSDVEWEQNRKGMEALLKLYAN